MSVWCSCEQGLSASSHLSVCFDEPTNQDIEKFFLGLVFREIFKMNFERFLILYYEGLELKCLIS